MDIFGSHECKISLFYKDADDTASKMLPRTWSKNTKERKDVSVGCFGYFASPTAQDLPQE